MAANVNLFFLTDTRVAVKVQYIMACSLMLQTVSSAVYESSVDCKNDFEILFFFFSFLFTKDEGPKTPFSEISVGGFGGWRRVMGVWVGLGPEVVSNPHEKGTSRDLLVC